MSEGEMIFAVISSIAAVVAWGIWYFSLLAVGRYYRFRSERILLHLVPPCCALLLWLVLRRWASSDVRDSSTYLYFYMAMGAAWVGLVKAFFLLLNLSVRQDAIERRNGAAAIAVAGGLIGLTLAFAGGNIGDGPGFHVVILSAGISTGSLYIFWYFYEAVARVSEAITVERDPAAGWRLAGFLASLGAVLGRGVAGNWVSFEATLADYHPYWIFGGGFVAGAIVLELLCQKLPLPRSVAVVFLGILPALLFAAAAAIFIASRGWWV